MGNFKSKKSTTPFSSAGSGELWKFTKDKEIVIRKQKDEKEKEIWFIQNYEKLALEISFEFDEILIMKLTELLDFKIKFFETVIKMPLSRSTNGFDNDFHVYGYIHGVNKQLIRLLKTQILKKEYIDITDRLTTLDNLKTAPIIFALLEACAGAYGDVVDKQVIRLMALKQTSLA